MENNLTQAELAKALGLGESTISFYESDKRNPDFETLIEFSKYFAVTTDYLLTGMQSGSLDASDSNPANHSVPIVSPVQKGEPLLSPENFNGYLVVPGNLDAEFVIQVTGDGMIGAGILEGDYIVCRTADSAQNGQIVVVLKNFESGFSEFIIKYFFDNGKTRYLRAANPQIPDITMNQDYQVAGIMAGLIRKTPPGYHIYRDYLNSYNNGYWGQVLEKAISYGITPQHLSAHLDMQWEMAKKMNK